MQLFEPSDTIGGLISAITYDITGSQFLTVLLLTVLVFLLFMAIATPFGLPLEFSVILILPLHIALISYNTSLMAIGGVFLIFAGFLIAKNILTR
jgi:hypothetical protein